MQNDRPTFSPFWHRVRTLRPRLRPHVQATRQHYRGGRWHVLHDPASNAFYRLSPVSHEFVGLLDGRRSVEEAWDICLTRHSDEAPTQNEVIQLLSQLYMANLLSADVTPEVEQLLKRGRQRLKQKVQQQVIGLMYFRVRLFNPDAALGWLEPIFRPLISPVGLVLWLAWVLGGLYAVLPQWSRLEESFRDAIAPANWGWMLAVFVVLKLIHEGGHGLICKRFGGQVPEFGAMMLVLVPAPYVDASSAWAFPSKWRRIAVGAGGMIFELAVAAGAAWVWRSTAPGQLESQLAFNAMLTASVSTLLFNANPLMKFDGYYMLSDLLDVPNLMQRSMRMVQHQFQRYVFGIRSSVPPTTDPGEAVILNLYAWGALAYRVVLFISITLYVMGKLFALGLILAVWTAAAWFLLPIGKFLHWLASSPNLADRRARAVLATLLMVGAGVALLGLVRMPDHRRAQGVVTSDVQTGIYAGVEGFVEEVRFRPGDAVAQGDVLVRLENAGLREQIRELSAQLEEARALYLRALVEQQTAAQVARDRVEAFERALRTFEDRRDRLVVRAPHAGVLVGADPSRLMGSFVREGEPLCELVDPGAEHLRFSALLTQAESLWIHDLRPEEYTAQVRRVSDAHRVIDAQAERVFTAGLRQLPHPALGYAGGGLVEIDQRDESGQTAKSPVFTADFRALERSWEGSPRGAPLPGERIKLRFTLPSKPLLAQWWDRLQKMIQGRARV